MRGAAASPDFRAILCLSVVSAEMSKILLPRMVIFASSCCRCCAGHGGLKPVWETSGQGGGRSFTFFASALRLQFSKDFFASDRSRPRPMESSVKMEAWDFAAHPWGEEKKYMQELSLKRILYPDPLMNEQMNSWLTIGLLRLSDPLRLLSLQLGHKLLLFLAHLSRQDRRHIIIIIIIHDMSQSDLVSFLPFLNGQTDPFQAFLLRREEEIRSLSRGRGLLAFVPSRRSGAGGLLRPLSLRRR